MKVGTRKKTIRISRSKSKNELSKKVRKIKAGATKGKKKIKRKRQLLGKTLRKGLRRRKLKRRRFKRAAPPVRTQPPVGPVTWVACTVTSASNIHRAKVMARSLKQHVPNSKLIVCVVEEYLPSSIHSPHIDEVILAKDLNTPDFYANLFKYNVSEGTTSMKAATIQYAMAHNPDVRYFLYLDTDMKVYHPIDELIGLLNQHPIYLTSHVLDFSQHQDGYLHAGIFNSGILALARSEITDRFLEWWDQKLYHSCFFDDRNFADQGWLDFAPLYFDAQILRHPGYNMAAWNLGEPGRKITHSDNGYYYLGDRPLCIYHYSGTWGLLQDCMRNCLPDRSNLLYSLFDTYMAELDEMGKKEISHTPWSYDFFENGDVISKETREKYKENYAVYKDAGNPFKKSNADFPE